MDTAMKSMTNTQRTWLSHFDVIACESRRAVIKDEIRRETDKIATTRHACDCGESCRRIMCARCWKSLLEWEPKK